jgi:hypothetical protein
MTIEGVVAGQEYSIEVPAERFASMFWVTEELGPKAVVTAGMGTRDRLREAIQRLSPSGLKRRNVYRHTGWIKLGDAWVYLHAGGGIGEHGAVEGIEVRLEPPLDRFELPLPPDGADLVQAVRDSLGLLDGLVPDCSVFPLFPLPFRVTLDEWDASAHLVGTTGAGKTELAALIQRHFGSGMDADHMPGSWLSTGNALEGQAFQAKDAVFVIDDFNPIGPQSHVDRMNRDADRIFRAQGNSSGRSRMRADGTLRPPKPPRGVILSTGEDVPAGHSLRARLLIVELSPGEIHWARLSQCQENGASYSAAMAGYLRWVAGRLDELRAEMQTFVPEQRDRLARDLPHGRTATIGADLLFGLLVFLRFAQAVGAIDKAEGEQLARRGHEAILECLRSQESHHADTRPVTVLLESVTAALQSKAAHLADRRSGETPAIGVLVHPETARLAGWRLSEVTADDSASVRTEWRPGGAQVGWIDIEKGEAYLVPKAALGAAQRTGERAQARVSLSERAMGKALSEAGLLLSKDRERFTKRVSIGGQLPRV